MKVHVNNFVRRQTPDSPFSCLRENLSWEALAFFAQGRLAAHGDQPISTVGPIRQGYRDGVVLIDLPGSMLGMTLSGVSLLTAGDQLSGKYAPRTRGESPRKAVWTTTREKLPSKSAFLVLYSSDLLAETAQNNFPPGTGSYEIISFNASPIEGEMPIAPDVLIANHLEEDGGTPTGMTDSEFVEQLRLSRAWWADKAMCG